MVKAAGPKGLWAKRGAVATPCDAGGRLGQPIHGESGVEPIGRRRMNVDTRTNGTTATDRGSEALASSAENGRFDHNADTSPTTSHPMLVASAAIGHWRGLIRSGLLPDDDFIARPPGPRRGPTRESLRS